jgi:predicted AlkP superfamily phosphohydrolase/phosphomutase
VFEKTIEMQTPDTTSEKAFILGLDGIPWDLIERWTASGDLPNFARAVREGAAGPLHSTTPPTTPLAWPSIATGTWPNKHGVYGFQRLSGDYTKRMNTSNDVRQPELWDVLAPAVVANVPMTYPADAIDGTMVTGMMSPAISERFTHPPEFCAELVSKIPDYQIGLKWNQYKGREDEFQTDLTSLVRARRKLMRLLMETDDWRLFFFVYTAPDRLQHLIWDEDVLLDHYRILDNILGEVMGYADEHGAMLFVVSDHGFGPITKYVYLNRALEDAGLLVRSEQRGARGVLDRVGLNKTTVKAALGKVSITDQTLEKYLPKQVIDSVAEQIPGEHHLYDVNHNQTRAFAISSGAVFINDTRRFRNGAVDPEDVPAVKREVLETLRAVSDPETGEAVLKVYDGDELYSDDEMAPDVVVSTVDGYEKAASLSEELIVPSADIGAVASHRSEGMFIVRGPAIEAGASPAGASVVDVAPTLLHSLGLPVGESMDGRVLTEVFHPDSEPARRAVETRPYETLRDAHVADQDEDYGDVEERLRGLGYME